MLRMDFSKLTRSPWEPACKKEVGVCDSNEVTLISIKLLPSCEACCFLCWPALLLPNSCLMLTSASF